MGRKPKTKIFLPLFQEVPHEYIHPTDGSILDSVTYILKKELNLYSGFKSGPGSAAERGADIHSICQFYDEGDLVESSVAEEYKPWFEQYKKAKAHHNIKVLACEFRRFCEVQRFAGTVDRLVEIDGKIGVLDIKTQKKIFEAKEHKYQLAAYCELIKHEHPGIDLCRWILHITPEEFKLVEYPNPIDFREWLVILTAYKIKMRDGFLKKD